MFDVLSDQRVAMSAVVKPTKDPMLFVGPGRLALAKLEQVLAGQFDAPFKLKDAIEQEPGGSGLHPRLCRRRPRSGRRVP